MATSVDAANDRVSYTQTNPLFDMSLSRSDLYNLHPDTLKPARPRRQWCFNIIVVYLILQTPLNAFLLYKVFTMDSMSSPRLDKQVSNRIPEEPSERDLQTLVLNNTKETKTLRGNLWSLQTQVNSLCGADGQLDRMKSELNLLNTSTKSLGDKLSDISLKPGPPGPPGLPGDNGNPGEKGLKGDMGIVGPQGPKGDTGLNGQTGPSGNQGPTGPTGPSGPRGFTGPKGDPGNQGPGAKGEKGSPGIPGDKGGQGTAGVPGPVGRSGLKGDKGSSGAAGAPGLPGAKGSTGSRGPTGLQGAKGEKGSIGATVRLAPGPSRGRVEVNYKGSWGTVCDDNFDSVDGKVVCKMLGYQRASNVYAAVAGTGTILLDELRCVGTEMSIFDCPHAGIGVNNCNHNEDIGVVCV
ncbi:macrophage receptor MARCO [Scomber scombrus]|uniref:macrophage receptor MARCO n=1 Tax=Scomber scombrus TaxID=13677 RepID=UPI002DD81BD5|nr:macrophage receptor MARCO [Scomber scombrus]